MWCCCGRKAKGAVKEASNVVKETVKELDETVPQPQLYRFGMTPRHVVDVGSLALYSNGSSFFGSFSFSSLLT